MSGAIQVTDFTSFSMFSLIITIISIALVAALALATLYYGGSAFQRNSAGAKATQVLVQGQQLISAAELYRVDHGKWPESKEQLVAGKYLKAIPEVELHAQAMVASAHAATVSWEMPVSGNPTFVLATTDISESVCREINRQARGDNGILEKAYTLYATQCFGPEASRLTVLITKEPDTIDAVIDPAQVVRGPRPSETEGGWFVKPLSVVSESASTPAPSASSPNPGSSYACTPMHTDEPFTAFPMTWNQLYVTGEPYGNWRAGVTNLAFSVTKDGSDAGLQFKDSSVFLGARQLSGSPDVFEGGPGGATVVFYSVASSELAGLPAGTGNSVVFKAADGKTVNCTLNVLAAPQAPALALREHFAVNNGAVVDDGPESSFTSVFLFNPGNASNSYGYTAKSLVVQSGQVINKHHIWSVTGVSPSDPSYTKYISFTTWQRNSTSEPFMHLAVVVQPYPAPTVHYYQNGVLVNSLPYTPEYVVPFLYHNFPSSSSMSSSSLVTGEIAEYKRFVGSLTAEQVQAEYAKGSPAPNETAVWPCGFAYHGACSFTVTINN